MFLYQRSIFKKSFFAAFFTIMLFTFILLLGNALKDLLKFLASDKIGFLTFLNILLKVLPSLISYSIPIGILTGVLLVFGELSSKNELVALKSAGLSLYQISVPIFLLAILTTVFALFVNLYYGPNAIAKYRSKISTIVRKDPLKFIQERTFIKDFPGYVIYVGKKTENKLSDCWLWEIDKLKRLSTFIKAKNGHISYDKKLDTIKITLLNGIGEKRSDKNPENIQNSDLFTISFKSLVIPLPLKEILGDKNSEKRISYMNIFELISKYKNVDNLIQMQRKNMSNESDLHLQRLKMQVCLIIQKNFVMSFSILALVLIAIPLGIKTNRSETFVNVVIAFILGIAYYFCVVSISWLENRPSLRPDLLLWIPNFCLTFFGIYCLQKANKH